MFLYAGIGSRETPAPICDLMFKIGAKLASLNWLLRSGHAKGADRAFEDGCVSFSGPFPGKKEIFTKQHVTEEALELASQFHPAWHNCDEHARKLHARNGFIILGEDLKTPVNIVIAYAPGGLYWGGTSQGLRVAHHYKIPILNMFDDNVYLKLKEEFDVV